MDIEDVKLLYLHLLLDVIWITWKVSVWEFAWGSEFRAACALSRKAPDAAAFNLQLVMICQGWGTGKALTTGALENLRPVQKQLSF